MINKGDFKSLSRALTQVENNLDGHVALLQQIKPNYHVPVIGITGPPGAGKSTLVNALINRLSAGGKYVAVLAIDPTSPFNLGSLLGDRIRMSEQFNKPNVFIRSLATRGSLGGLSAKTIEMTDVLRAAGFDYILIETVGVGQSEVEIAGLADTTVVVLVPESGDEIQNIKSGLMEIADIFVVNKADREGADAFVNNLRKLSGQKEQAIPVIATVASKGTGLDELIQFMEQQNKHSNPRKNLLIADKAWKLIQHNLSAHLDKKKLQQDLAEASQLADFNLYRFVESWIKRS
ncbi:MAG: methylmalonyl Co-A mutase-associated GTPase MeaB [Sphingobacteriaceae bacterium]